MILLIVKTDCGFKWNEDSKVFKTHKEAYERGKQLFVDASPYKKSVAEKEFEGLMGTMLPITKIKEEQQLVFGWANIAKDKDGNNPLDWEGDIIAPEILEKAAYNFVLKFRATGEMHEPEKFAGSLVESVMFTKEKMASMGIPEGIVPEGWWVGFYIPDSEVFAKIKNGNYRMFSIQGLCRRDA